MVRSANRSRVAWSKATSAVAPMAWHGKRRAPGRARRRLRRRRRGRAALDARDREDLRDRRPGGGRTEEGPPPAALHQHAHPAESTNWSSAIDDHWRRPGRQAADASPGRRAARSSSPRIVTTSGRRAPTSRSRSRRGRTTCADSKPAHTSARSLDPGERVLQRVELRLRLRDLRLEPAGGREQPAGEPASWTGGSGGGASGGSTVGSGGGGSAASAGCGAGAGATGSGAGSEAAWAAAAAACAAARGGLGCAQDCVRALGWGVGVWAHGRDASSGMSPFWIWTQAAICVFVLASIVIAIVKLT